MYPGKVSRNHFLPGYGSCFSRCGFGSPLYTLPLNSTSIPDILISASIFYISETSSFQNFETSKKKKKTVNFRRYLAGFGVGIRRAEPLETTTQKLASRTEGGRHIFNTACTQGNRYRQEFFKGRPVRPVTAKNRKSHANLGRNFFKKLKFFYFKF